MDELDRQILDLLRRDARTPYTEIADEVGTSEGTVRNRVEQLVDSGVIERFTVATRTGNVKAMIEIRVDVNVHTGGLTERLVDYNQVDLVWQVSGEEDIVLVVDTADTEKLNNLITRVRELDEVVSTKTRLILDEWVAWWYLLRGTSWLWTESTNLWLSEQTPVFDHFSWRISGKPPGFAVWTESDSNARQILARWLCASYL